MENCINTQLKCMPHFPIQIRIMESPHCPLMLIVLCVCIRRLYSIGIEIIRIK